MSKELPALRAREVVRPGKSGGFPLAPEGQSPRYVPDGRSAGLDDPHPLCQNRSERYASSHHQTSRPIPGGICPQPIVRAPRIRAISLAAGGTARRGWHPEASGRTANQGATSLALRPIRGLFWRPNVASSSVRRRPGRSTTSPFLISPIVTALRLMPGWA